MEGLKSFAEKPRREEAGESVESLAESVERAQELLEELKAFDDVEMIGGEAMALNRKAEELASELTSVLERIPAKDCIENRLPYHPTDKKLAVPETPIPTQPDYPLDYVPAGSDGQTATDTEKAA